MFETVIIVDWSGGNDRGPRPVKDAIWACVAGAAPVYLRNRGVAEEWLNARISEERAAGRRVFVGFDFPFGYPAGFAARVTGCADSLALWDWFAGRVQDEPEGNNRFDLAGELNGLFDGVGPFWGNTLKREIDGLPRKGRVRAGHGMPERRACEEKAKGALACWQMCYAGSVGGQVMMGLPVLARLRRRFQAAAWPMEDWRSADVVLVEVWPSLLAELVSTEQREDEIKDAAQVRVLARQIAALGGEDLVAMLDVSEPRAGEEGWIFGLGFEAKLANVGLRPPPLRDDCFALPAGVDWTPVDDALSALETRLHPVVARTERPVARALGYTLSEDVIARRSNPPTANSAVDGYGFAYASVQGDEPVLALVEGRSAAGDGYEGTLPAGAAIRILTGAPLPEGVDTVILQEDVSADAHAITFRRGIKAGANTRCAGEDVAAGEVALEKGRKLTPADLALGAALGLGRLPVYDRLRVAVFSTGDELVEAGESARPEQIYDANRPMLCALLEQMGFEAVDLGRVPDARDAVHAAFEQAAEAADVIITSGGASAGDEDHVSALLRESGAMQDWRIAVKPGRPLALGVWGGKPVFGLPGNPVAAMVCCLVFARPALGMLAGQGWAKPQGYLVPAGFEKSKKQGRREYLRARMRDGRAQVFKSEGSGRISGLSWAEGLIELPDEAVQIREGDLVRFIPYGAFF